MKRYDLNMVCEGESGRCLEKMVDDVAGDYVMHHDAKDEIDKRDTLLREALSWLRALDEVKNYEAFEAVCLTNPDRFGALQKGRTLDVTIKDIRELLK